MADYSLTPVINKASGKYALEHYNEIVESCEQFIKENSFEVCNDLNYSSLKKSRTEIRAKLDAIKSARININEVLLGDFNEQIKTLEKMLNEADQKLKGLKDDYERETNNKTDKQKILKLEIKTYNEKTLEKVKQFALKNGCEIKEIK